MVAHVLQLKLVGALADLRIREVIAVVGLGEGLGPFRAQAQRADQRLLTQGFAEDFQRGLF
ncbi:hypothetical protein D3C80_1622770 [compost metagenome]